MALHTPSNYAEHEAHVIANAEKFTACCFKGRGTYEKKDGATLAAARTHARNMIGRRNPTDTLNKGRPVLVYAVMGVHQVVADTVYP